LFCTSWVNSFTGCTIDVVGIGQICRNNRVIFVLNAAQGLGARVLDVRASAVDAVTCRGFKWLCGPYATGFCWLVPTLRESLTPRHAYWLTMQAGKSLDNMRDYSLRTDLGARAWDVFCTANFFNFVPWLGSTRQSPYQSPSPYQPPRHCEIGRGAFNVTRDAYANGFARVHSMRMW